MKMNKTLSVLVASAVVLGALTGCGGVKKKKQRMLTL